jgi:tetratricopeptide (TPR) repeat protein
LGISLLPRLCLAAADVSCLDPPYAMSGFRSPLDAYREDLSRMPDRQRLGADDEFWIILATGLRRLAQAAIRSRPATAHRLGQALVTLAQELSSPRRDANDQEIEATTDRPLGVAEALAQYPDPEHAGPLVSRIRAVAADAEEAGAMGLAREMLTDLVDIATHAKPLERGLVLLQLGRIARTLGDLDGAQDLLESAGDLGRTHGIRELEAREALGLGVIARTKGNYPAARAFFERGLSGALQVGLLDVQGMCHQGLMIVCAEGDDFDSAIRHAWHLVSSARTQGAREAEALATLAQLCAKAGYDAAALGAFMAALARTDAPRIRLPILAGIAASAGRLRNATRVGEAERAITAEANDAYPFETSGAWLAVARARRALGDVPSGDAAAEKAAVIAHAYKFYEITHRLEQEIVRPQIPLADVNLEFVRSLESWSNDPAAELSFSSVPMG